MVRVTHTCFLAKPSGSCMRIRRQLSSTQPLLGDRWSTNTGGIYFNCSCSLDSTSRLQLRGSRIQSAILSIGYGGSGTGTRDVFFDPRFANGAFAPPFFPVTQLNNNSTTTTTFSITLATSNVATQSNTWQRITN